MVDATEWKVNELLRLDRILCQDKAEGKIVLIKRLAGLLRKAPQVKEAEFDLVNQLMSRERLGSTVLSELDTPIALPHLKLADIDRPCAALIILARSLVFDDQKHRVRIVFGLILPTTVQGSDSPLLKRIRSFFAVKEHCRALEKAETPQGVMQAIREW